MLIYNEGNGKPVITKKKNFENAKEIIKKELGNYQY